MSRIVVGVDGSPNSIAALRWAVAEAALRGASVEAVTVFHVPYGGGSPVMPLMLDPEDFRVGAAAELAKAVKEVDASSLGAPIIETTVEGGASAMLVVAGERADLLVVGARGHGGLTGMLLGSVSRQVSEHADVPVVIVPAPRPSSDDDQTTANGSDA